MKKTKIPKINWKKSKTGYRVVKFQTHDRFMAEIEKTMNSISFLRKQIL